MLLVDWDLEAPGLDRYFIGEPTDGREQLTIVPPKQHDGLMGLLGEALDAGEALDGGGPMRDAWESRISTIQVPPHLSGPSKPPPIEFLPSGHGQPEYSDRLSEFSWDEFYRHSNGHQWLESLRESWSHYDFVMIDARTGLTDAGAVCTVHFADILVLVFTANEQSLEGGIRYIQAVQEARRTYPEDRAQLAVIPLLSRWEGDKEVDIGDRWLDRLNSELAPFTEVWLPKNLEPRQFLEKSRVPNVPRFSFGECLPVLTHSLTDSTLPGASFEFLARMLHSCCAEVGRMVDPDYSPLRQRRTPIVFISSTSEDLKDHRARAQMAAVRAGFLPRMMEYFAASGEHPPLGVCLAKIAGSEAEPPADVLVVIVANRYGWVPQDQTEAEWKSITWLECEQAKKSGKEVLAFVVDKDYAWPFELREETRISQAIVEGKATPELFAEIQNNVARLREFKSWLDSQGIRATFTTPESLHGEVVAALHDWRNRHTEFRLSVADLAEPAGDPGRARVRGRRGRVRRRRGGRGRRLRHLGPRARGLHHHQWHCAVRPGR